MDTPEPSRKCGREQHFGFGTKLGIALQHAMQGTCSDEQLGWTY